MTTPLLTTKLYIPTPRPEWVPRRRLSELLDQGLKRKMILISAPAGFGKTTLLSDWLAGRPEPAAWVSLDEGDNDPIRFWSYLVAALKKVHPGVGEGAMSALKAPQPVPIESTLTTLINEIAAMIEDHVLLVLDDLHVIEARPIHQGLAFLLEHLPPNVHLILSTRVDPPISLARLRASNQVTEVRTEDLRFAPDEAAGFLARALDTTLLPTDVAALEARTEGWIAGLQMAALSMEGREDVAAFIKAFTGSNRYVMDYLVEEVLQREPEHIRRFLLETAILDRLTGPLCDAVTQQTGSETRLAQLEASNLFIISLDQDRKWYRYHRLFADLLRSQLSQAQPDAVPVLHLRASRWFQEQDLTAEAITHALAAGDIQRVADLIEQDALEILDRSELATLYGWLEALADEVIRSRPWLCVFHAWMLLWSGQADMLASRLQDAETAIDKLDPVSPDTDRLRGYIATIRAQTAFIQGDVPNTIAFAHEALAKIPRSDQSVRASAALIAAPAYVFADDVAAAIQAFEQALESGRASGNQVAIVLAGCGIARLEYTQGQLAQAARSLRDLIESITPPGGQGPPSISVIGYAHTGLAIVLHQRNDLEAAERHAREGVALCGPWGQADILLTCYATLAQVQHSRGDLAGALATLQEAMPLATALSAWSVTLVTAWQARIHLARGEVDAAVRWAQTSGLSVDDTPNFSREFEHQVLARVLAAQGDLDQAAGFLTRMVEASERCGRKSSTIENLALLALVEQAQDETGRALDTLARALVLAEPEGHVRAFVDEGPSMRSLLQAAVRRGDAPQHASTLLAAFREPEPPSAQVALVEPLSDRELAVLRLAAAGLSNREIADELVVSINTVKTHTKSLYAKLGVHKRTQAINRAQDLGLL